MGVAGMPDTSRHTNTIHHHGGAQGVTGSCHELVLGPDASLLIDCGLFQGEDAAPRGGRTNWPLSSM